MKKPLYNLTGDAVGEIELIDRIFNVPAKASVVHQVVVTQQANAREVLADTKDKGEVRGGGKKPWKQKGTGRARHGSSRSPIWRGGGVTFGPNSDRTNFARRINKKQKQLALAMCLSEKASDDTFVVVDDLKIAETKTKAIATAITALKKKIASMAKAKKVLFVLPDHDIVFIKSVLNLKNVRSMTADSLNCVDVLHADVIITSKAAVGVIDRHYQLIREKKAETPESIKTKKSTTKKK